MLWSPYGGGLRARLLFRVGQADETLPTRGITHLAEHLALSTVGQPVYPFNGSVDDVTTGFEVMGEPEEVVEHLAQVCTALQALPMQRLDVEKQILRIEDDHHAGALSDLRVRRFGCAGFGLSACPEFGLHRVDAAVLQRWASQVFTAGNAVLWLSGPPPAGLRLPLPPGPRYSAPPPAPRPFAGPTWFAGHGTPLALSAVGSQSEALSAGAWWLERLLHRRLRLDDGRSYSTSADLIALSYGRSELVVQADGTHGDGDRLVAAVRQVLGEACWTEIPNEDLAAWHSVVTRQLAEPTAVLGLLDRNARRLLLGEPLQTAENAQSAATAVTGPMVQQALARTLATALLEAPMGTETVKGWAGYPEQPTDPVSTGTAFAPAAHLPSGERLLVGPHGTLIEAAVGRRISISWDNCAIVLRWASGRRQIAHLDGTAITLHPEDWADGQRIAALVDQSAPDDRLVDMPDETDGPTRLPPRLSGIAGTSTSMLVILIVAVTLMTWMLISIVGTSGLNVAATVVTIGAFAVLDAALVRGLIRRLRAPEQARRPGARARTTTAVRVDTALARADARTTLGIAVAAWAVAALFAVGSTLIHAAYWPTLVTGIFASRATVEYRRRGSR